MWQSMQLLRILAPSFANSPQSLSFWYFGHFSQKAAAGRSGAYTSWREKL
jgi:hypothetical protein